MIEIKKSTMFNLMSHKCTGDEWYGQPHQGAVVAVAGHQAVAEVVEATNAMMTGGMASDIKGLLWRQTVAEHSTEDDREKQLSATIAHV